ncbi:myosin light chain 1-like [Daphnia carinata]|uniref:myosin light chain 1-like n=1 Tax=Daphnia carinata TaxID=120202 RepID=UPI00257FF44A|nr:myosin light chain 1-like [Daphnia carinata]
MDLSARDIERGKFAFSIYDFEGNETMDMFYLGDALRALNLNPTLAQIEKMGGTKKKGEKKIKADEFLPIFCQIKKDKDVGTIEDFIECMKLYDKTDNGTMIFAELQHILMALGERLEEKEVDDILAACCDPEDDDGMIPYKPFLEKLIAGPFPEQE